MPARTCRSETRNAGDAVSRKDTITNGVPTVRHSGKQWFYLQPSLPATAADRDIHKPPEP